MIAEKRQLFFIFLFFQVSKSFARGWSSLMDMFDDMLIKDIVPTATAAKQNIERVLALGTIGRDSNPKDIIAYMKQGGRQVPFNHPAGKGKVACHCCTAFCNSLQ